MAAGPDETLQHLTPVLDAFCSQGLPYRSGNRHGVGTITTGRTVSPDLPQFPECPYHPRRIELTAVRSAGDLGNIDGAGGIDADPVRCDELAGIFAKMCIPQTRQARAGQVMD